MYKTAEELGIEQWEFNGLFSVADLLKKAAVHAIDEIIEDGEKVAQPLFNMDHCAHEWECGTVACIGGWNYIINNGLDHTMLTHEDRDNIFYYVETGGITGKLGKLYYPPYSIDYSKITPAQAVEAIENFKKTGDPDWFSIIGIEDPTED